jgi:hypothetical protein
MLTPVHPRDSGPGWPPPFRGAFSVICPWCIDAGRKNLFAPWLHRSLSDVLTHVVTHHSRARGENKGSSDRRP